MYSYKNAIETLNSMYKMQTEMLCVLHDINNNIKILNENIIKNNTNNIVINETINLNENGLKK